MGDGLYSDHQARIREEEIIGSGRKDDKDKGKYLLMVLWYPSLASLNRLLLRASEMRELVGFFASSVGKGGSLFWRKLDDR